MKSPIEWNGSMIILSTSQNPFYGRRSMDPHLSMGSNVYAIEIISELFSTNRRLHVCVGNSKDKF